MKSIKTYKRRSERNSKHNEKNEVIEGWKKLISIIGIITQTIGFFMESTLLIILGSISLVLGVILLFAVK